jgi:hypothetical protein
LIFYFDCLQLESGIIRISNIMINSIGDNN